MKKIIFRADAGPSIGTGDLVSFIHLSRYFERRGWECYFVARDYPAAVALLNLHNIRKRTVIRNNVSAAREVEIINGRITKSRADAVFLQVSENALSRYSGIANNAFRACAYFGNDLPAGYDLVLNWDVGSEGRFDRRKHPGTKFFLGPEYIIISADFDRRAIKKRTYGKERKNLAVMMGGADERNFTARVVKKLDGLRCGMKISVILGAGYRHEKELGKILAGSSLDYKIKKNVKNMFDEYMGCDVAIGAGGLTASELVVTGTPAMLTALYEHQIARCGYFGRMGWVRYLGYRSVDNIDIRGLESFVPDPKNRLAIKIEEVVRYMDRACS